VSALVEVIAFLLVAAGGAAVVFTREPLRQSVAISFFGLFLAILFLVFQAPGVALSELVVGAVGLPLLVLLSLTRIREPAASEEEERGS
jgi:uncharacterized MnhB-related membrane protein